MSGSVEERLNQVRGDLAGLRDRINAYLRGDNLDNIKAQLIQVEATGSLPAWFNELKEKRPPSKTDGKSLGTMVEKLLKAELSRMLGIKITGSAAAGVDIPELSLNTKCTSDNKPQSSEPFQSAYERVLGTRHDMVVCIYTGDELLVEGRSLRLLSIQYLEKTEVADSELCLIARKLQQSELCVSDPELAKRVLRCIVYAKKGGPTFRLMKDVEDELGGIQLSSGNSDELRKSVAAFEKEVFEDVAPAMPNDLQWQVFLESPLNGRIGISFALQWRFAYPNPDKPPRKRSKK